MTDLELAKAVRARLLEFGHTTGDLGPPAGPNCIIGAAYNVLGVEYSRGSYPHGDYTSLFVRLTRILGLPVTLNEGRCVWIFNDRHPERVIPHLDRYIAAHDTVPEPEVVLT